MEQLFSGIEDAERESLLGCLQAVGRRYKKGELVLAAGDKPAVGLVREGAVQVIAEDPMGNRTIIGRMEKGDLFGEAFACAGAEKMPFSVEAASDYYRDDMECTRHESEDDPYLWRVEQQGKRPFSEAAGGMRREREQESSLLYRKETIT